MQSDHNNSTPSSHTPDQKIKRDLATLTEQINLCRSMLTSCPTPASVDANESLLSVIGFLEACVPRMVELIEAAATGALAEEIFEECLVVNDKLTNVLADVDKDARDRMPLTPAASSSAAAALPNAAGEQEINLETTASRMDNLNIDESKPTAAVGKTEETSSSMDLLAPTPPTDDPFSILDDGDAKPAAEDDDFDSFFKDRTSAHGGKED